MPLFRRSDGDPLRRLPPVRRLMPYLMRSRAESVVLSETIYDVARARQWLAAYERAHPQRASLFALWAYACARALHARPELNRFVSGGRIYQRREVSIAFAVKVAMEDAAPLATVKLPMPAGEGLPSFVSRLEAAVAGARHGGRRVDREVSLFVRIPGPLLSLAVRLVRRLDAWNLLPAAFTRDDPMFASLFVANLGSAGVGPAYHHLYEYGTTALFGTLSLPRRAPVAVGDAVEVREVIEARWTFDERIHDGMYAARSLALVQSLIEDPASHLGDPADFAPGASP